MSETGAFTCSPNNNTNQWTCHGHFPSNAVLQRYDSPLMQTVAYLGFALFALLACGYAAHSILTLRQHWLRRGKALAFFGLLWCVYPLSFAGGFVLQRPGGVRINVMLLLLQPVVWGAFLSRYITVATRVPVDHDSNNKASSAVERYVAEHMRGTQVYRRHARRLVLVLLAATAMAQVCGDTARFFSLFFIFAIVTLLATLDMVGFQLSRARWQSFASLRYAIAALGFYALVVALLSPAYGNMLTPSVEAILVLPEHLLLALLALGLWHSPAINMLKQEDFAPNGNSFVNNNDDTAFTSNAPAALGNMATDNTLAFHGDASTTTTTPNNNVVWGGL
jgi:hypothetical protein